jgi:acylphosphatase
MDFEPVTRVIKSLRERIGLWLSWRGQTPGRAGCPDRNGNGLDGAREAMNRCRLTIYYTGRVQGVGFRFTTKSVAAGYDVVGVVRNLADGRVELTIEGERIELEAFRRGIQDSGVGGLIRGEEAVWGPATGAFRGFEIG